MLQRGPKTRSETRCAVSFFLGRKDKRGRESDVHGGSKNSMPRLNNPSSTASSVRSLRRGQYIYSLLFSFIPFRKDEAGKREKQVPKILRGAIMDGLDALSTTYLPTVELARPVSRPPRYTKEFSATLPPLKRPPVNLRRGPPTCILAHLLTPP